MSVRIIVDSTADIVPELKAQMKVVPLTIIFGAEEFIDGVTITHKDFYEKLIEGDDLPSTSQATPAAFAEVFEEVAAAGDTAVVLTVSSKLSGTYQSAMIAAEDYQDSIFVVDTMSVAIGSGILADHVHEMLIRSDGQNIWLLPACNYTDVSFRLAVNGGAVVSVEIENGELKRLQIDAEKDKIFNVYYKGESILF